MFDPNHIINELTETIAGTAIGHAIKKSRGSGFQKEVMDSLSLNEIMRSLKLKFTGDPNSSDKDLLYHLLTVSNLDKEESFLRTVYNLSEEESWDMNEQDTYSDDNTTLAEIKKRKRKKNSRKNEDENEIDESTSNSPSPRPPITKPLKKVKARGPVTSSKMKKYVGFADPLVKKDEVMETGETPIETSEQKTEEQKVVENVEDDKKIGEESRDLVNIGQSNHSKSKKKLLVLDVNGLLADIVSTYHKSPKPDKVVSHKGVYKRPFCDDFLKFFFEKFNVGIWSSRTQKNLIPVLDCLMKNDKDKLLFCWKCEKTGCVQEHCVNSCNFTLSAEAPWYFQEPLYLRWKEWDCRDECRYHCMVLREAERKQLDNQPVKYHGKWPFRRVFGIQEPVSVAVSMLNLALIFHGWLSFFILLHYKLPLKPDGKTYYEYTGLWHIYAILSMNSWFWSAIFHSRYVELTERLYYSSTLAFLGFVLLLSIIRSLNIRAEAARVMVAAPVIAFVTTHILFLNIVQFDYEWNLGVVAVLATTQLIFWVIYGIRSHQPARWKLWFSLLGSALAMLLEIIDVPPYKGLVDSHALWQATSIPITYIWWSFIKDDAEYTTLILTKKSK